MLEAPGPQPAPDAEVERLQAKIGAFLATGRSRDERESEPDGRPPEWKRFGLAGGGVVLAVALVGAWAGMKSSAAPDPKAKAQVASLLLPPPTDFSVEDPASKEATPLVANLTPPPPPPHQGEGKASLRRIKRSAAAAEDRPAGSGAAVEEPYYSGPAPQPALQPAPGDAPVTAPIASAMPLPNNVIARTLHRIGYSCGSVSSTAPVDSAGGYKVTCTSGHSYSAKPVRGRYHFRRLGGG